jgi:hypothetical protein
MLPPNLLSPLPLPLLHPPRLFPLPRCRRNLEDEAIQCVCVAATRPTA